MDSIIIDHLRIVNFVEEPHTVKEISTELDIPDSTVRDSLERLKRVDMIKTVKEDSPREYAVQDYEPLVDEIKEAFFQSEERDLDILLGGNIERLKNLKDSIAVQLGRNPEDEDFTQAFFEALPELRNKIAESHED